MKKIFVIVLLLLPTLLTFGEQKNKKPKKEQKKAPAYTIRVGSLDNYYTTREKILANPKLVCDQSNCRIISYTMSWDAPGHDFFGPVFCGNPDFSTDQQAKIREWDYKGSTLYIQDIHINCDGQDITMDPIILKWDH